MQNVNRELNSMGSTRALEGDTTASKSAKFCEKVEVTLQTSLRKAILKWQASSCSPDEMAGIYALIWRRVG